MSREHELSAEYEQMRPIAESWTPEQALRWGFQKFADRIAIASGFGVEGMVVIDLASRLCSAMQVFVLDTKFLFPETYALIDRVERRYGIAVERVCSDLSPEVQASVHGSALWSRNPDQCCALRKVTASPKAGRPGCMGHWGPRRSDGGKGTCRKDRMGPQVSTR